MPGQFIIRGGRPLSGIVPVFGSKNNASKLMIASLLTDEPCVFDNVPRSGDIEITQELCERIGSSVEWRGDHALTIETRSIRAPRVLELSRKNRIPVLALGPLLHRAGVAEVPVLGGCPIGHRPINFHVEALAKMGVTIERRAGSYYAEAKELRGADIAFPFPSVGATENVILAAVRAKGETRIANAAIEPEVLHLIGMLKKMGGRIRCDESARSVEIQGVSRLSGVDCSVMPDRNEIVSFVSAALATGGEIFIPDISPSYLKAFLDQVAVVGGSYEERSGGIHFSAAPFYAPARVETAPHPGFMTDWQQPFCVLLTRAKGESLIHETVYEDRFAYIEDLKKMGADIEVFQECPGESPCRFYRQGYAHAAHIRGPVSLRGAELVMTDIRAGMAHMIAALAARGESRILGIEHVDRGYERIDERLRTLGADIKRIS